MTHTYNISGMTCEGCKASVIKYLSGITGVKDVSVDLQKSQAEITMDFHISPETFQKALPEKYSISEIAPYNEKKERNIFNTSTGIPGIEKSKFQQLTPLFLILGYISMATVLLNYKDWSTPAAMLDFMGLFLIVFSFFKMLDLKGFPDSFRMYDPLAKRLPVYALVYPFIETILGLMFLMRFQIEIALVITILILGITTYGVTKTLLDKKAIQCACLGTALKLPMTEATFIENAIMLIMGFWMLAGMI